MDKVKLTPEQAHWLEKLKAAYGSSLAIKYKSNNFDNKPRYKIYLDSIDLIVFCNAIINGYEIEAPPYPTYSDDNVKIEFNWKDKNALRKQKNKIYININTAFDIDEVKQIVNHLEEHIEYYEKYVK